MAAIFYPPKSPIVRGVKYDCHIMHPLKDQREGVKYGRGVKYGVTPPSLMGQTGVIK